MKVDRNRLKFAIRAQVQPSVSIHAAGLLDTYRTLTKSNVLHQSQRLKWFYARWQATPGKYFPFRILQKISFQFEHEKSNETYIPASFAHTSYWNTRRKCACKKALDRLSCFSKSPPEKLRLQCCSHNSPCRQWIFVRSYAQTCVRSMIAFPAFTLRKTAKDEKVFSTGAFSSVVSARHVSKRSRDILF